MVVALVAIDVVVAGYLEDGRHYDSDWRLPKTLPSAALPGYVEHIESLERDEGRPVVLFLGASPTWGEMNSDASHATPAYFQREARNSGLDARVYNLGMAGALVSNQYFIAGRLAGDYDLLAVQLTYHTFGAAGLSQGRLRFPELPELLGEPVSGEVADLLDIDATRTFNLSGSVEKALRREWTLYGGREELALRLFDRPARDELFTRWRRLIDASDGPELASRAELNTPFDSLDPSRQTQLAERYGDLARYRIDRRDSELRMLDLLCERLERRGSPAVFYMSPLNTRALEDFDLFDRSRYEANVEIIRQTVERHGLAFIDWNRPSLELPPSLFADITHTTDAGSAVLARRLFAMLQPQLEKAGTER